MPTIDQDMRLDRLFEYTKFHIGIYLSAGSGLVALIGLGTKDQTMTFASELIGKTPSLDLLSLIFIVIAGLASGVIASYCTECVTYDDLWKKPQGPFGIPIFSGRVWAGIEHSAFWVSANLFACAVLKGTAVHQLFK